MTQIPIDQQQFDKMAQLLARNPSQMLLSPDCRQFLALDNFHKRGKPVAVYENPTDGVMPGTVAHNRIQIDDDSFDSKNRPARLIWPLLALDYIFQAPERFKVLSIGPRTEMELYYLVGAGFLPENIKAVDLISTSPWIEPGDMHALPYADRSFDIVISSWVLAYSRTPQKAVDEMMRVLKHGGFVAIGCSYNPKATEIEYKDEDAKIQGVVFRHVSQYRELFGDRLGDVYFQVEPEKDRLGAVMMVAKVK